MIFNLDKTTSIANVFLAELRDENIQKDAMRFRKNMERLGEFFAYEISKTLEFERKETQTPLGLAKTAFLPQQPVLATILRAGIPLHQGLLNIFDRSESTFITAYRKNHKNGNFVFQVQHITTHELTDK